MDPFAGVNADPQSLHRYLYARSNPANAADPSGAFSLIEVDLIALVRAVLLAMNVVSVLTNANQAAIYGLQAMVAFRGGRPRDGYGLVLLSLIYGALTVLNVLGIRAYLNSVPLFPPPNAFAFAGGPRLGSQVFGAVTAANPAVAKWVTTELIPAIATLGVFMATPSQMSERVRRGQGPRGLHRIDKGHVPTDQWHAHAGPGEGSDAVNIDGSVRHGGAGWLTNRIKEFLRQCGFALE